MTEVIELGERGLYYLTDTDQAGVFIIAETEPKARELAVMARRALVEGTDIPGHISHDHTSGTRIMVPDPNVLTPEQRVETITRFAKHLKERLFS
jgi:hypothetical protein